VSKRIGRLKRKAPAVTFADMPSPLLEVGPDSSRALKEEREAWLEAHNLAAIDFFAWKRAQDPLAALRPPSRRKFLSPKEREALDDEREREGRALW
jgi:hypothetical protein